MPRVKPGENTSFGALKQIDAGLLNVRYAEAGRANAPAAVLLHGWPFDIHSYVDVVPCWRKRAIAWLSRISWLWYDALPFCETFRGTIHEPRMYQLIRQKGRVADRTFTIEFLDSGVQAFSFTFG